MLLALGFSFGYLVFRYDQMPQFMQTTNPITQVDSIPVEPKDSIQIVQGTFLGNLSRNYYGDSIPLGLDIIWLHKLGSGPTIVTGSQVRIWSGAGWTGQPLFVTENGHPYIIQGCYDHHLKKIDAVTGQLVWQYKFDDVIKGTGTIWEDPNPTDPMNRFLILQGSRLGVGNSLRTDTIPSYRAISYLTGEEVWRMNVKRGPTYSRDVDGSALLWNNKAYVGFENGFFNIISPGSKNLVTSKDKSFNQIEREYPLFDLKDRATHGGELTIESSPCKLGNHLYITTSSGHIYGYNLTNKKVDWDLYLAADMNGSPVATNDNCLIITLEKQFINGHGGVMKINPSKSPDSSVVWFLPTADRNVARWYGGIIGSASVNDYYKSEYSRSLACVSALDGYLYLIDHKKINDTLVVLGPDNKTEYRTPIVLSKEEIGPTISTPIFINNRICAATYTGIHIFEIIEGYQLNKVASYAGIFESTPTAYNGRIYIASKNGFMYCFGDNGGSKTPTNQLATLGPVQ